MIVSSLGGRIRRGVVDVVVVLLEDDGVNSARSPSDDFRECVPDTLLLEGDLFPDDIDGDATSRNRLIRSRTILLPASTPIEGDGTPR